MDTSIVNTAGTVQLIGLAIILIMVIVIGARVAGLGAKGFASLIGEVAGLLVALWIVARPNDATGILIRAVGGVQTPAAISRTVSSPTPPPSAQQPTP